MSETKLTAADVVEAIRTLPLTVNDRISIVRAIRDQVINRGTKQALRSLAVAGTGEQTCGTESVPRPHDWVETSHRLRFRLPDPLDPFDPANAFVGMAEMKSQPYWRRYAWHRRMPEILAIAYGSFVGSSGPLNSCSSRIGCAQSRG